jgi:hypothetical protein
MQATVKRGFTWTRTGNSGRANGRPRVVPLGPPRAATLPLSFWLLQSPPAPCRTRLHPDKFAHATSCLSDTYVYRVTVTGHPYSKPSGAVCMTDGKVLYRASPMLALGSRRPHPRASKGESPALGCTHFFDDLKNNRPPGGRPRQIE